jgi:hypothetical protein
MPVVFSTFYSAFTSAPSMSVVFGTVYRINSAPSMPVEFSTLFTAFYSELSMPVVFRILYNAFNRSFLNASGIQHPLHRFNSAPSMSVLFSILYTAFNSAPSMPVVFSTLYTAFNFSTLNASGIQHPLHRI